MKPLRVLMLIAALVLAGCQETVTHGVEETSPNPLDWTAAVPVDQARKSSGDEAKALLIARAYVEAEAKKADEPQPQFFSMTAAPLASGWRIHFEFVARWNNDQPSTGPGYWRDLELDKDWKVVRSTAGPQTRPSATDPVNPTTQP